MPTITLTHCQPVTVLTSDVEYDVLLDITVGGAPVFGAVVVSGAPAAPVPIDAVPCGGTGSLKVDPCREVKLHYVRTPMGPDTMDVTFTIAAA